MQAIQNISAKQTWSLLHHLHHACFIQIYLKYHYKAEKNFGDFFFLMFQLYYDTCWCTQWGLLFSHENYYLNFVSNRNYLAHGKWKILNNSSFNKYPRMPWQPPSQSILEDNFGHSRNRVFCSLWYPQHLAQCLSHNRCGWQFTSTLHMWGQLSISQLPGSQAGHD